jgi:hypothetical protein
MRSIAVRPDHVDIVVPEDTPAGDMPSLGLSKHRIVRALAPLLALEVRRECHRPEEEFVRRALHQQLSVLEIAEAAHARHGELLQGIGCLDLLTAEPRDFRHQEHLKRRPRLQRVHEPQEPGPIRKLGAGDPVVDVDMLVADRPALGGRVCPYNRVTLALTPGTPLGVYEVTAPMME